MDFLFASLISVSDVAGVLFLSRSQCLLVNYFVGSSGTVLALLAITTQIDVETQLFCDFWFAW